MQGATKDMADTAQSDVEEEEMQPIQQPNKCKGAHVTDVAQSDGEEEARQGKQQPSKHKAARLTNAAHSDDEEARPAAKLRVKNPSRLQRAALMPVEEDEGEELGQVQTQPAVAHGCCL